MHKRKVRSVNDKNTLVVNIPTELVEYLQLKEQDVVILRDEQGKHGKYITIWKE